MPINIPDSYVDTFENTVRQLAQQKESRFRMCVTEVNKQSQAHSWDRLAQSQARLKTSPRTVSPSGGDGDGSVGSTDGLDWTRRQTLIKTYDTGEIVEPEDIVEMLIDPKNASTENLVMNMKRQVDDIIIENALGDALDGDGSAVTFPAGQIVGDYSTEISLDFVTEVDEKFSENDVDMDIPRYFAIGPKQRRKLLQLIEVVSGDYQDKKALTDGYLPNFLGFNWIMTNRLNVPSADQLDCFAFTAKGIGLHTAGDITADVAQRPDMSFAWQIYLKLHMDAVRTEDEHVVHAQLADTVT